jgi:branched-chain amino acid transport system ATP-binding protein
MTAVLKIEGLTQYFGGLAAVNNFELTMEAGELVGLIGPNGAGKTTVFNLITGVYRPTNGTILFNGKSLVGMKSYQITSMGIARTFQTIRLYGDMTVWQNVAMGSQFRVKYGLPAAILRLPAYTREEKAIHNKVVKLLDLFGLSNRIYELAKNLPYGEQRRLEICRALAADPEILLLDEPAAGMNPNEVEELLKLIRWVHSEFKLTTLLIEHQMKLVMNVCPRIVVIDFGQIIARGTPDEIQNNPSVIEAYLGKMEEEEAR